MLPISHRHFCKIISDTWNQFCHLPSHTLSFSYSIFPMVFLCMCICMYVCKYVCIYWFTYTHTHTLYSSRLIDRHNVYIILFIYLFILMYLFFYSSNVLVSHWFNPGFTKHSVFFEGFYIFTLLPTPSSISCWNSVRNCDHASSWFSAYSLAFPSLSPLSIFLLPVVMERAYALLLDKYRFQSHFCP